MKFKVGDPVLVYRNISWLEGGVGVISARDISEPDKPAYCVMDVSDRETDRWIKEEFVLLLNFAKPPVPTLAEKLKMCYNILRGK
jgi:hypothetical protein